MVKTNSTIQVDRIEPKIKIDSALRVKIMEDPSLAQHMLQYKECLDLDIYDFCLSPEFIAIEEELNFFFNCLHEKLSSMTTEEVNALIQGNNFDAKFDLFIENLQVQNYGGAFEIYEQIAPMIHCEWDHDKDYAEVDGKKFNIPIDAMTKHNERMVKNMDNLLQKYPALNKISEQELQMVLQTAFVTSIVYYGKGINIPIITKLPVNMALRNCMVDAQYNYTMDLVSASALYAVELVLCSENPLCIGLASWSYYSSLRSAYKIYKYAEADCHKNFGY